VELAQLAGCPRLLENRMVATTPFLSRSNALAFGPLRLM
jgi:hypothetical protein